MPVAIATLDGFGSFFDFYEFVILAQRNDKRRLVLVLTGETSILPYFGPAITRNTHKVKRKGVIKGASPQAVPSFFLISSRRTFFMILPTGFRGMASIISSRSGSL